MDSGGAGQAADLLSHGPRQDHGRDRRRRSPTEPEETAANTWLPEHELRVYSTEYERTGFQGGLQWYRCAISPEFDSELALFSGRTIDVPSSFISGSSDWGHYQRPGALEAMQSKRVH